MKPKTNELKLKKEEGESVNAHIFFGVTVILKKIAIMIIACVLLTSVPVYAAELNDSTVQPYSSASSDMSIYDMLNEAAPKKSDVPENPGVDYFKRNLVPNLYDVDVYLLTLALKYLDYNIEPTYSYDSKVTETVKSFQKDNGLSADGKFGELSRTAMNKLLKAENIGLPSSKTTVTVSKAPTSSTWIFIDKSSNLLYHMKGNDIVRTYGVATGATKDLTPEGKFTIVIKIIDPSWGGGSTGKYVEGGSPSNPLGKRWMGLNIGGGGTYGIHGTTAPSSIGTYASNGCVRMNNAEVEYLFELIPTSTPVWIGTKTLLSQYGITITYTVDSTSL